MQSSPSLASLRQQIDSIDDQLIRLLAERMNVSQQIGLLKQQQNVAVVQPQVAEQRLQHLLTLAQTHGLSEDFVRNYWTLLHTESCRRQQPA